MALKVNIQRKILREVDNINQNKENGIFADVNNQGIKDPQALKILVIGPEDSPYCGGFFLFKLAFPIDFPFSPPKVLFLTPSRHPICRLHPNLYQEGKVCLSILNTWAKTEWSPVLTLEKLFLTIQGLLDQHPLAKEPGYEYNSESSVDAKNYRLVALYRTLKVGVLAMFDHPDLPPSFRTIMIDYFQSHRQKYLDMVEKLAQYDGIDIHCFHGSERIDYQSIKSQLLNKF